MIAGIADIARHRRYRKSKATAEASILYQPAPINAQIRETHANLGSPGMGWDEPGGEGCRATFFFCHASYIERDNLELC
jgi:hypothetical protein